MGKKEISKKKENGILLKDASLDDTFARITRLCEKYNEFYHQYAGSSLYNTLTKTLFDFLVKEGVEMSVVATSNLGDTLASKLKEDYLIADKKILEGAHKNYEGRKKTLLNRATLEDAFMHLFDLGEDCNWAIGDYASVTEQYGDFTKITFDFLVKNKVDISVTKTSALVSNIYSGLNYTYLLTHKNVLQKKFGYEIPVKQTSS